MAIFRKKNPEGKMPLIEHLREFRKRLVISLIALVLGTVAGWFLSDFVWDLLRAPLEEIAKTRNAIINYPNITSSFDLKISVSITLAIFLSSPIWLYQIWAFLAPALTKKEKLYGLGFSLTSIPLFVLGCLVGWLIFPNVVYLMTSFAPVEDATFLNAKEYFDFVSRLMIIIGISFVLPVVLVLLNFLGLLSAKTIWKSWRWALLIILIFAGAATPAADLVSMFILAGIMYALYLVAVLISYLHDRFQARKLKKAAAAEAENTFEV